MASLTSVPPSKPVQALVLGSRIIKNTLLQIRSEVNLLPSHLLYILYADIQAHVKASPHIIYSICHFTLLLSSPLPAFRSLQVPVAVHCR